MSSFRKDIEEAAADFFLVFAKTRVWIALGWNDVQARYNRSRLGVFWASLSILIFVGVLGPIYAHLFEVPLREYTLHLMLGIVAWNYVHGIIMESGREYINAANYLISFQLSYFTLLFRVIWRNLVVLSYQMLVFLLLAMLLGHHPTLNWLMAPVALVVITLNALWMGLLMSVFATRFRDLSELLNNILRLVFFATPIMWMPGLKPGLELVVELNPFFHLIEVFRAPLLSGSLVWNSWTVVLSGLAIGWIIAFPLFAKYRSRIAFWL